MDQMNISGTDLALIRNTSVDYWFVGYFKQYLLLKYNGLEYEIKSIKLIFQGPEHERLVLMIQWSARMRVII